MVESPVHPVAKSICIEGRRGGRGGGGDVKRREDGREERYRR
jgi:hypothetical protein